MQYLAEQTGITPDQARQLIREHGNDRATLVKHAKRIKQP
ncbi:DUF3606 domain-containing protein [Arvimicrobium flavum]|nr:DUF3606 domain-containing protein [Mesorhizobium shangrilense]